MTAAPKCVRVQLVARSRAYSGHHRPASGAPPPQAPRRLEAIRLGVASYHWRPITGDLPVTVSIGAVSVTPAGGDTQAELLAEADRRLYAAKRAGRDRVVAAAARP